MGKAVRRATTKKRSAKRAPTPNETIKARAMLEQASKAKKSLLDACDASRTQRGDGKGGLAKGTLTDAEQDLLRAMLVFAGAGLDAVLKQLIKDALRALAAKDPSVQAELEKFATRQLRDDGALSDAASGKKFLGQILASTNPQARLLDLYIKDLTGDSLQSPDQVMKTASALGLDTGKLAIDVSKLRKVFDTRNRIIHELDIDLDGKTRKRNNRRRDPIEKDATLLLDLSSRFVDEVERKLQSKA